MIAKEITVYEGSLPNMQKKIGAIKVKYGVDASVSTVKYFFDEDGYKKVILSIVIDNPVYKSEKAKDLIYKGYFEQTPGGIVARATSKISDLHMFAGKFTPHCDHCNVTRERKYHHIFINKFTHNVITIGSSCVEEYFGLKLLGFFKDAAPFFCTNELEDPDTFNDDFFGVERGPKYIPWNTYFSMVQYATDNFTTFTSVDNSTYEKPSTKSLVQLLMLDKNYPATLKELIKKNQNEFPVEYKDKILAKLNSEPQDNLDFNFINLIKAEDGGVETYIYPDNCLPYAIFRTITQRNKEVKEKVVSEYIGTIGDKLELDVIITGKTAIETQYGVTRLYFMKAGNNTIKYFATGSFEANQGQTVNIKATIKDHKIYRDEKETIITRAKIL